MKCLGMSFGRFVGVGLASYKWSPYNHHNHSSYSQVHETGAELS
jgi:hypothetical protein